MGIHRLSSGAGAKVTIVLTRQKLLVITYINAYINMYPENFFRALADETRLRCVVLIQQQGELCVCELSYALNLAQPKISRHLATLKATKILQDRREGLWIFYNLHPELPSWLIKVLQETVAGHRSILLESKQ
ncbi:regulatory protein, ArsR [Candidatus Thiomargarita nelsonii]|uniref:Regulatory protein, ArsR n=1 Tax=Candidatus Thiomargarita nelsonii TaxID=1003181 RepID=A0A176RZN4_9GAMM|nr:regulatory protein, ArsR [Candidatus Thiomargarita nelsonii]